MDFVYNYFLLDIDKFLVQIKNIGISPIELVIF